MLIWSDNEWFYLFITVTPTGGKVRRIRVWAFFHPTLSQQTWQRSQRWVSIGVVFVIFCLLSLLISMCVALFFFKRASFSYFSVIWLIFSHYIHLSLHFTFHDVLTFLSYATRAEFTQISLCLPSENREKNSAVQWGHPGGDHRTGAWACLHRWSEDSFYREIILHNNFPLQC